MFDFTQKKGAVKNHIVYLDPTSGKVVKKKPKLWQQLLTVSAFSASGARGICFARLFLAPEIGFAIRSRHPARQHIQEVRA